jgi:hypothetical protein
MTADDYVERLSEDEGLTSGLGDDEATVLLDALRKATVQAVGGKSGADADAAAAKVAATGRLIGKVVAAWAIDGEPDQAKKLWTKGGGKGSLDGVSQDDAVAAVKELLSREGLGA